MKRFIFTGVLLCLLVNLYCQPKKAFIFASRDYRDSITTQLKKYVDQTVLLSLDDSNYSEWSGAFWAMELMLYRPKGYEKILAVQLSRLAGTDPGFQRSFMEMLYTLYPKKYAIHVNKVWQQLKTDKVKVMALEYMAQAAIFPKYFQNDLFFHSEYYRLYKKRWEARKIKKPSKKDFLQTSFSSGSVTALQFSIYRPRPGRLSDDTKRGWNLVER